MKIYVICFRTPLNYSWEIDSIWDSEEVANNRLTRMITNGNDASMRIFDANRQVMQRLEPENFIPSNEVDPIEAKIGRLYSSMRQNLEDLIMELSGQTPRSFSGIINSTRDFLNECLIDLNQLEPDEAQLERLLNTLRHINDKHNTKE